MVAQRRAQRIVRSALVTALTIGATFRSSYAYGDEEERRWYGYANLACDGVALGTGALGLASLAYAATGSNDGPSLGPLLAGIALFGISGLSYLFGSPIVHLAHSRPATAAASFGMRLLPAVPVIALRKANVVPLLVTITSVMTAAAIGVDDFVLAYDHRPRTTIAVVPSTHGSGAQLLLSTSF